MKSGSCEWCINRSRNFDRSYLIELRTFLAVVTSQLKNTKDRFRMTLNPESSVHVIINKMSRRNRMVDYPRVYQINQGSMNCEASWCGVLLPRR